MMFLTVNPARIYMRYFFLLWTALCLTSTWSNILAFNFSMLTLESEHGTSSNVTYIFSPSKTTLLTSMMAAGAFIANFVVTPLYAYFGSRVVFTAFGLLSVTTTALMPWALSERSFPFLLVLRIFQGVAFAANYPMIGIFVSKWTCDNEAGLFVSALVAHVQLAPAITNFISGPISQSSLGWQGVIYGHAMLGIFIFAVFFVIYRDEPESHFMVSAFERQSISISHPPVLHGNKSKGYIPYKAIFKTKAIWAIIAAAIGNFYVVNTVFFYSTRYFNRVLHLNISDAGLYSALPPLIEFFVKLMAGTVSDKMTCYSRQMMLRIFNSIGFLISAGCFVVLAFLGVNHPMVPFVFLNAATGALGFTTGGFFKCVPLLSKQYSQFVMGVVSQIMTLLMILVPIVMQVLTPRNTVGQWDVLFWILAAVLLITNTVFVVFCEADPAEWTKRKRPNKDHPRSNNVAIPKISNNDVVPFDYLYAEGPPLPIDILPSVTEVVPY